VNQQKSSIDPAIKAVFLLKNIGFLIVLLFLFVFCCENTYNRVYGDNHYKNKIGDLLKNGKTIIADLDDQYVTHQVKIGSTYTNSYDFKYSFKVDNKTYDGEFTTEEFIPQNPERLIKYMTVHYLPENPEINQIDAELEYEFAKDTVEEHTIGMLLLNLFGLVVSFFLILYVLLSITHKIKNFDQPIENTIKKQAYYNEVNQKTDYSKIR